MQLTDREKEQLKAMIDAGQKLPARYKAVLFERPHEAELIWPGKSHEVTNVVLPFQIIEQIDEPRAGTPKGMPLFNLDDVTGRQTGGWTNKLIWGDNKLVLASLKNGPLRREIEAAGGLKLVYIDPPFDIGADFSTEIEIGDQTFVKEPSVIEELAYRDTWGSGVDSFASMMYERLRIIHDLIAPTGSLYVHIGYNVSSLIKVLLDEIFGPQFFMNEIVWKRTSAHSSAIKYGPIHDTILYYVKSETYIWNKVYTDYEANYINNFFDQIDPDGKQWKRSDLTGAGIRRGETGQSWRGIDVTAKGRHWGSPPRILDELDAAGKIHWPAKDGGMPRLKQYPEDMPGVPLQDIWTDIRPLHNLSDERVRYPTQKPEPLLARVIEASSNTSDLIADFFCGSGTTLAVAERLGRKWIGCDLGRFAIHTSRKRLIGVQRELKEKGEPYRSFEILNLGKYERQYFVGIDPTLPDDQRRALSLQKEEHFLTLILNAYKSERVFQSPPFHGRKAGALVLVGPIDAPVTQSQVHEAVAAARKLRVSKLDVLGFEFEMGLVPHAQDEARSKGVNLAIRYIPKDVFDRRAVEKGQIVFYDVAFVEVQPAAQGRKVTVKLKDFGVYYRQDDIDALVAGMKNGGSKVTVEKGQVVRLAKDKNGVVTRDVLTKAWSDWTDYWAVDFDFENRKEIVRITEADGSEREAWTGGYIFENEWQSYRTRKDRTLELESTAHEYPAKGRYKIAVKVIDIFGNDTTKVVEVAV